jgi:hypothetical protein
MQTLCSNNYNVCGSVAATALGCTVKLYLLQCSKSLNGTHKSSVCNASSCNKQLNCSSALDTEVVAELACMCVVVLPEVKPHALAYALAY